MFSGKRLSWAVLVAALFSPSARAGVPCRTCSSCKAGGLCDPFAGAGVLVDPVTFGHFETRWRPWPVPHTLHGPVPSESLPSPRMEKATTSVVPDWQDGPSSPYPAATLGASTLPSPQSVRPARLAPFPSEVPVGAAGQPR